MQESVVPYWILNACAQIFGSMEKGNNIRSQETWLSVADIVTFPLSLISCLHLRWYAFNPISQWQACVAAGLLS